MDADDLPSIDPNIDYRKSCESRLMEFEYKLQKVEASLLILESQLSSIEDLDGVEASPSTTKPQSEEIKPSTDIIQPINTENSPTSPTANATSLGTDVVDKVSPSAPAEKPAGPKASEDLRFSKFFKMVQFGVPPAAVKLKMQSEGLDPNILDKPNDVVPGYSTVESSSSETSDSD